MVPALTPRALQAGAEDTNRRWGGEAGRPRALDDQAGNLGRADVEKADDFGPFRTRTRHDTTLPSGARPAFILPFDSRLAPFTTRSRISRLIAAPPAS